MLMLLFNLVLLALWLRLLPQRDDKAFFNPYVAGGLSLTDRMVRFLQPVLGALPPYLLSVVVLLFLILFRGVAVSGSGSPWTETIGLWTMAANTRAPTDCIAFSFIAFGLLLHRLWVLEWLLSLLRPDRKPGRASVALTALAMPVSAIPSIPRAVFLLVLGAGLGAALLRVGVAVVPIEGAAAALPAATAPVMGVLALASIVDVLNVASQLVMVFIILSFVGAILRSPPAMTIGNEGVDLLVGAVFPRPMNAGGLSFAPVAFFIVAGLIHQVSLQALRQLLEQGAA